MPWRGAISGDPRRSVTLRSRAVGRGGFLCSASQLHAVPYVTASWGFPRGVHGVQPLHSPGPAPPPPSGCGSRPAAAPRSQNGGAHGSSSPILCLPSPPAAAEPAAPKKQEATATRGRERGRRAEGGLPRGSGRCRPEASSGDGAAAGAGPGRAGL